MTVPANQPRAVAAADGPAPPGGGNSDPPLEWSFNPWREHPGRASAGALAIVLVLAILLEWRLVALAQIALAIAVGLALGPALMAARCRVDEAGVARRVLVGWDRRSWTDIRRAVVLREGLLVSRRTKPGARVDFGGLWLPVPHAEGERLLPELRRRVAQHGL